VTTVARPGSVLVTQSVRDNATGDWDWSFARERKLKGVGEVKLHRARRPDENGA
jgi:class 3 adenylate cyclase